MQFFKKKKLNLVNDIYMEECRGEMYSFCNLLGNASKTKIVRWIDEEICDKANIKC